MNEIISMMRKLSRHGVTHFVVSDELAARFKAEIAERNKKLDPVQRYPLDEDDKLVFHGRPLLTQADLKHLLFKEVSAT